MKKRQRVSPLIRLVAFLVFFFLTVEQGVIAQQQIQITLPEEQEDDEKGPNNSVNMILHSLPALEQLRRDYYVQNKNRMIRRVNNVDVLQISNSGGGGGGESEEEIGICHIVDMNRHSALIQKPVSPGAQQQQQQQQQEGRPTTASNQTTTTSTNNQTAALTSSTPPRTDMMTTPTQMMKTIRTKWRDDFPLQSVAVISLALQHLNTGDGSVIPEVAGLNQRCNIRFTAEFMDTSGLETQAVDNLIPILQRDSTTYAATANGNNNDTTTTIQPLPCAFLGGIRNPVSIATGLYTSLKGYPQFSGISTAPELDNKDVFPLFGRTQPSSSAIPLLEFLTEQLHVNHIAVVHTDGPMGIATANDIREAIASQFPQVVMHSIGFADKTKDFSPTIANLKATKFRFIYLVSLPYHHIPLMREAHKQGLIGEEYNWIMMSHLASLYRNKKFDPSNNEDDHIFVEAASKGLLLYEFNVGSARQPGKGGRDKVYEQLLKSYKSLANSTHDIEYLQSKLPHYPPSKYPKYNPRYTPEIFLKEEPESKIALIYDAAIAIGLGACKAAAAAASRKQMPLYFDGVSHYKAVVNSTFRGASGNVILDQVTGSRIPTSKAYAMQNLVPAKTNDDNDSNTASFNLFQTHIYYNGIWMETDTPITFSDGTTNLPVDLPPVEVNYNSLGLGLRVLGYTMAGIVILLSLTISLWTIKNADSKRIVKTSQPIFLLFICLGTMLMGASIIPISSIEEEKSSSNDNNNANNIACISTPWLLSLGWCFAFSALFSKTRRINIIFHNPRFKRIKVEPADVILPMMVLVILNILVLTLWTVLSPLEWNFEVIGYDEFNRAVELQGSCSSSNMDSSWAFIGPLVVVNGGALLYAIQQAYVARNIHTAFAESEWIARAMSFIMLVFFVGFPVLVIAKDEPKASYFIQCSLIFVVCMSLLGFIFIPKVMIAMRPKTKSEGSSRNGADSSVGLNVSNHSMHSMHSQHSSCHERNPHRLSSESESTGSNRGFGLSILVHPKLQNQELKRLKEENKMLKAKMEVWQQLRDSAGEESGSGVGVESAKAEGMIE